jgi:hypothetical protein
VRKVAEGMAASRAYREAGSSARSNKPETAVAGFQSTNRHELLVTRRNWSPNLSCHRQFNQLNESDASRCRSAEMGFKQFPISPWLSVDFP